jgi:cytochrome c oxidase subunit 2
VHSALNPVGPRAEQIADLMLLFFAVSAVVYAIVIAFFVYALMRARRRAAAMGPASLAQADKRARLAVAAGVVLTVLTLAGLASSDFIVGGMLKQPPRDPLRVLVTGHQFWWEIEYEDPVPSQRLRTANELHIPVGRPVQLILTSRDVIHSFWIPSAMGKMDLIPGRTTNEILHVSQPGTFTGQCAEFCGHQHSKMRLTLHAVPPEEFEAWKTRQLAPAHEPQTDMERRGQQVFMQSTCVMCHAIQGTQAGASVAPDLTHVAARRTLAAGALPNTPSDLAGWVLDPQRVKPGSNMPPSRLPPDDLSALVAYLMSLQ